MQIALIRIIYAKVVIIMIIIIRVIIIIIIIIIITRCYVKANSFVQFLCPKFALTYVEFALKIFIGGGGGGTSICMHIGYVPRERPPFSALNFRSGAYHFHKFPKNLFRSITNLHFLVDFAVPETIFFKISLISTRSSPPTARSARTQSVRQCPGLARRVLAVPEIPIFTLKTDQARSGAPHFQAQYGSSSFRSPAFSRSTGNSLPIFHFAAAHTYQNLGWVLPPPPPPGSLYSCRIFKSVYSWREEKNQSNLFN